MAVTVEQVVASISAWQGKQIEIQPLSGGLTNTNYRVDCRWDCPFRPHPGR